MDYTVKTLDVFERQATKLIRKYPSLEGELRDLIERLKTTPTEGISLGKKLLQSSAVHPIEREGQIWRRKDHFVHSLFSV